MNILHIAAIVLFTAAFFLAVCLVFVLLILYMIEHAIKENLDLYVIQSEPNEFTLKLTYCRALISSITFTRDGQT